MSDEFQDGRHDASRSSLPNADELERQAREALAQIRSRVGGLGSRVRRVVERAGSHWEASAVAPPQSTMVPASAGERARALARRWADIDFLVDPELASSIAVHALDDAFIWRAEVRERGETRLLEERAEPYRGAEPAQPQTLPALWDYQFALTPDIASGEQRERLPGAGSIEACGVCGGNTRVACRDCGGQGSHVCPRCHGRARVVCMRCRGRGRISATDAGTGADTRGDPLHLADHADRLLGEAGERIAHLRERLRMDLGVPPPPARYRAAAAGAPADGVPCPECEDGTRPCECVKGRQSCATCAGTGKAECGACRGTGRLVRHREVVRRFDTRIFARSLGGDARAHDWVPADVLARGSGETVWQGPVERAPAATIGADIPADIWQAAMAFGMSVHPAGPTSNVPAAAERRVIERTLALTRLPLTRIEYAYSDRSYVAVAFGRAGAERFWAETFPHRWSRVGRFLRALSHDLSEPLADLPDAADTSAPAGPPNGALAAAAHAGDVGPPAVDVATRHDETRAPQGAAEPDTSE